MSWPIKRIFIILESPNGRYYGFRYIRCSDGAMCEAQASTEGNIIHAFTYNQAKREYIRDYFYTRETMKERDLFKLPVAHGNGDELRQWAEDNLKLH